jgi:hypothetical protein
MTAHTQPDPSQVAQLTTLASASAFEAYSGPAVRGLVARLVQLTYLARLEVQLGAGIDDPLKLRASSGVASGFGLPQTAIESAHPL